MKQNQIRNFAIISHIDHGKSTLADRLMELTGVVKCGSGRSRLLDSHPIEQERGITIKLAPVRMSCEGYTLNLIDTPGHVDFSYEVSRSLKACEGVVLLVDATTGIQAQTMANAQLALEHNLKIIPVVNKIDLKSADPRTVAHDLRETFSFDQKEILFTSAKTGQGTKELLQAIIDRIPAPQGNINKPLKSLVFNSFYHPYKGVIAFVRVFDGQINQSDLTDKLVFLGTQASFNPLEIGFFGPDLTPQDQLSAGRVGYIATGLKRMELCQVGDTISQFSEVNQGRVDQLPGYKPAKPMVFLDFYPTDNDDFSQLKKALEKLRLVDASLSFKPVNSPSLGAGFRLGFLGILHGEIIQERLERDYDLSVIATSPSVEYKIVLKSGEKEIIQSPAELPAQSQVEQILEPIVKASIFTPLGYLGNIMDLCQNSRGELVKQKFFGQKARLVYHLPLAELLTGFYDHLKSLSSGFASLDWQFFKYQPFDASLVNVFINGRQAESLCFLIAKPKAYHFSRKLAKKLKQAISRQQYEVVIQVAIGSKIIARERLAPFRKDVTAKLYGGDQTRKDKLLKKQKKGKKRLKAIGNVEISQEALQAVLSIN